MNLLPKSIYIVSLIVFFIIVLSPLLVMFADALISSDNLSKVLLLDMRQLTLLKNSLAIGGGTVFFSLLIGLPLAFLIGKTNLPLRRSFLFFSFLPIFIPAYITAISWEKLLGPSGINFPIKIYGLGGVIFILGLSYFPFITLLTLTGLYSIDSKLEESAALAYPRLKVLKDITLPLIFPYIFSGVIFTFIFSVSNYGVPDLLRVITYPVEIFIQFSAFYDFSRATLLALPLVALTLLLVLLQRHFMGKKSYITLSSYRGCPFQIQLGKYKVVAVTFSTLVIFFSVIIPLVMLLISAGSITSYIAAFKTAHRQIINSIALGCISATLITILSFPIGYLIQRAKKMVSLVTDSISIIPFAIPPAILGIGLIRLWNRPVTNVIYKTFWVIILAHIARFIAFSVRVTSSNISQIHTNIEEAASLVCKNSGKRLFRVMLPLTKAGLLYGWIICFALSIGELETTLLVTPAGEATLPIRIYTLMHYGAHKLVFSLCVILILIIFLPLGIIFFASKKFKKQGAQ